MNIKMNIKTNANQLILEKANIFNVWILPELHAVLTVRSVDLLKHKLKIRYKAYLVR